MRPIVVLFAVALFPLAAYGGDANRLAYLDENNPYYPNLHFPKLTTPMWVGEDGVDAVVILAIDDMRDAQKYETFLRPILNRLKKIDRRAPASIMTCQIDPKEPHLQKWLKEGLSLECHTIDHPCPLLQKGDFGKAVSTYDRCVDLMNEIPGNKPVAFRTPCCDSLNTVSPRFFAEIFDIDSTARLDLLLKKGDITKKPTNFLQIDSSVFNLITADDPALPRELVLDPDGRERFRKYLPADRTFVNYIENYPYPYVINRLCWEFPCAVPSDWAAQHLHKPNNPITVRDWKAYLDAVVIKQGVFNLVFHPHGWIKADQIIDLIDYAQSKYGKRVKFLTFKEAVERLNKNVLGGQALRIPEIGGDNGAVVLDIDNDGYMDAAISNMDHGLSRLWHPKHGKWREIPFPSELVHFQNAKFGILDPSGFASVASVSVVRFDGSKWREDKPASREFGFLHGKRMRDLDGDGICEVIVAGVNGKSTYKWLMKEQMWWHMGISLPAGAHFLNDDRVRFIDLDHDGQLDVLFATEEEFGVYLFKDIKTGWSRKVAAGKQGARDAIAPITHNFEDNGFFVHGRTLYWQNEHTSHLKDLVGKRSFDELLRDVEPTAKSPEASLKCIKVPAGFRVELMAAEPMVQDPVAFAWGPDGKLWVVEMGDYPQGVPAQKRPSPPAPLPQSRERGGTQDFRAGGRVKYLEDTNGDGKYDKATVFLDGLGYPTGVLPWRKGVLVTCAPDIFYAEDTDGDGKADKREVLFTGFAKGNPQHLVNTLAWGLDGWVYVANGDSGGRVTSAKRKQSVLIGGRDLRIKPDTGEMEAESGMTQFGRCRDDWGNWFGNNNSTALWHYVLSDRYLKRNPHVALGDPKNVLIPAGTQVYPQSRTLPRFNDPHTANRFTSACSPMVYRDNLMFPALANASGSELHAFVSEPVHNLVHRATLAPDGFTFRARRHPAESSSEFVASNDHWFRPTMLQTGPDGCLWIADMYRAVIEHPQWIPPEWQKKLDLRAGHDMGRIYRIVPVDKKPRAIPRMDKLTTAELVAALVSPNGWQRDMAQMMLLWRNDPDARTLLLRLVEMRHLRHARLHALCTLGALNQLPGQTVAKLLTDPDPGIRRHAVRLCEGPYDPMPDLTPALERMLDDPDPQVRLQIALTLGQWKTVASGKLLGKMARTIGDDRFLLAAWASSLNEHNFDAVLKTVATGGESLPPRVLEALLATATGLRKSDATATILKALVGNEISVAKLAALADVLDVLEQRKTTLDDKSRRIVQEAVASAQKIARDERESLADRQTALRLLGRGGNMKEDTETLLAFLAPQTAPEMQAAAVAALGRRGDVETAKQLLAPWKSFGPARRAQILELLLRRETTTREVIDALSRKRLDAGDLDATSRQRLLTHANLKLRAEATKLLEGVVDADRQKVIDAFRPALTLSGKAQNGRAHFEKACAACHKLGGIGNEIGPDLAALASRPVDYLLASILDPNRAVEARYIQYLVELKNGQSYAGLLLNETSTSITVAGSDGKTQTILRANIDSLTSTGKSQMPEGLEKDLKPQDMADLLAFLKARAPALKRKEFAGNKPEVQKPFPGGELRLDAHNAEIYGPTLVLETKYGNLGYWQSADDHAAWEIELPKAGHYEVRFEYACDAGAAGNVFELVVADARLTGVVASTDSWDTYRWTKVGEVSLPAGRSRLVIRPDGPLKGAMIDLRNVRLAPVEKK